MEDIPHLRADQLLGRQVTITRSMPTTTPAAVAAQMAMEAVMVAAVPVVIAAVATTAATKPISFLSL